jgi:SGNH hydrolase-like domain, acetyltransferase AlgX
MSIQFQILLVLSLLGTARAEDLLSNLINTELGSETLLLTEQLYCETALESEGLILGKQGALFVEKQPTLDFLDPAVQSNYVLQISAWQDFIKLAKSFNLRFVVGIFPPRAYLMRDLLPDNFSNLEEDKITKEYEKALNAFTITDTEVIDLLSVGEALRNAGLNPHYRQDHHISHLYAEAISQAIAQQLSLSQPDHSIITKEVYLKSVVGSYAFLLLKHCGAQGNVFTATDTAPLRTYLPHYTNTLEETDLTATTPARYILLCNSNCGRSGNFPALTTEQIGKIFSPNLGVHLSIALQADVFEHSFSGYSEYALESFLYNVFPTLDTNQRVTVFWLPELTKLPLREDLQLQLSAALISNNGNQLLQQTFSPIRPEHDSENTQTLEPVTITLFDNPPLPKNVRAYLKLTFSNPTIRDFQLHFQGNEEIRTLSVTRSLQLENKGVWFIQIPAQQLTAIKLTLPNTFVFGEDRVEVTLFGFPN